MYVTGSLPPTVSARPSFTSRRRWDSASDTAIDREPCGICSRGRFHTIRPAGCHGVAGRASSPGQPLLVVVQRLP